ncbi:MAG: hypothetical protein U5R06_14425 [candidate division KSB1 bacterium]|nr:hypothetical protein [candidate division KSB1 bacterium]
MPVRKKKTKPKPNSRTGVLIAVLIVLIAAELTFDIFEIAVGKVMLLTNSIRPKTGRLWEEEEKDQSGMIEVEGIEQQQPEENMSFYRLDDLLAALSIRQSVTMSAEEFKSFYRTLPVQQSRTLLDHLQFLKLSRNSDWHAVHFSKSNDQLVSDFVDGYDNLLHETIVTMQQLYPGQSASGAKLKGLSEFNGRVLTAEQFYNAFEHLPRSYQSQIVNDPYKLVQWGDNLTHVAISPFVTEQGVKVVFEVTIDNQSKLYEMFASEIAAGYLIQNINQLDDTLELENPKEKPHDP